MTLFQPAMGDRPSDPPASGYTLLEMLVALVIAGLAAAAIGGSLSAWAGQRGYRTTLVKLDWMIGKARDAAVREHRTVSLELTSGRRSLAIPQLDLTFVLPAEVEVILTGVDAEQDPHPDKAAVYFLADGSTSGARIEVRSGKAVAYRRIGWVSGRLSPRESGDD